MTDSGSATSVARSEPRSCPRCGTRGQSVDRVTVAAMMSGVVAPGFKSRSPEALVCYCFQYRRGDIVAELKAEGRSSIADRIAVEVQVDNSASEVRNPTGKCCLGEVRKAVQEISAELGVETRS